MQLFEELPEADKPNLKNLVSAGDKKAVFNYLRNLDKHTFIEEVSLAGYSLISHKHVKMTVIAYVMHQITYK